MLVSHLACSVLNYFGNIDAMIEGWYSLLGLFDMQLRRFLNLVLLNVAWVNWLFWAYILQPFCILHVNILMHFEVRLTEFCLVNLKVDSGVVPFGMLFQSWIAPHRIDAVVIIISHMGSLSEVYTSFQDGITSVLSDKWRIVNPIARRHIYLFSLYFCKGRVGVLWFSAIFRQKNSAAWQLAQRWQCILPLGANLVVVDHLLHPLEVPHLFLVLFFH